MNTTRIAWTTALLALSGIGWANAAPSQERSGKVVVETVCQDCHTTGKDGAPKIGDQAAWRQRASKGLDKLTKNAITGVRSMPAHGGQAQLSDLELTRAVAYMVSNGTAADTNKAYTPSHVRPGAQLVQERCQECHVAGTNGAPRIGEMNDWRARLTQGVAPLVRSAIKGHNSMPARGGLAGMSDVEMRSAVEFMLSKAGGPAAAK
ncbi:MAG: c-type cytochrome [Ideonella sp.]|jgi:cytochrome c5|nr:c-type cytochrome [Ideonella sp.]MBL0147655.1 c-type cytochrome [Ideonella sp.]